MNILITGGCGYKGSYLIPMLLRAGHHITSVDTQWFGNYLEDHKNLVNLKLDIRDINLSLYKRASSITFLGNELLESISFL